MIAYYNKAEESLVSLVDEIQTREKVSCSFGALERALKKRGIHCHFVKIGPLDQLSWNDPVIAHVDGGHFAVVHKLNEDQPVLTDLTGIRPISRWELWRRGSGCFLLTSYEQIADKPNCIAWQSRAVSWAVCCILTFCGLLLVSRGFTALRRSHRHLAVNEKI